ncbi:MAG: WD40 repeat domain-containing protein [Phormidesmis sp.]
MEQQPGQLSDSWGPPLSSIDSDSIEHNAEALNNLRRAVVLGQGQFSLILARANYRRLRQLLLAELSTDLDLNIVSLPPNATNLRDAIAKGMAESTVEQSQWQTSKKNKALTVIDIEEIETALFRADRSADQPIDRSSGLLKLLKAANLGRDELLKRFPYPVVLWVNDTVLGQMNRYAPDLKSFAATPIRFDYPLGSLVKVLSAQADDTFSQILESDTVSLWPGHLPLSARVSEPIAARELMFAIAQITQIPAEHEQFVSLDLLADLLFLQGRSLHRRRALEKAREHYEKSLLHWQGKLAQDESDPLDPGKQTGEQTDSQQEQRKDRAAVLLFHLGLWWRGYTESETRDRNVYRAIAYGRARQYFEAVLSIFEQQRRLDRVGRFILSLAEVVQKLKDWDELSAIAQKAIPLHQDHPIRLAQDYGYLAEALLAQNNNHPTPNDIKSAQSFVLKSLEISQPHKLSTGIQDKTVLRYQRGGYFYLLARTHQLRGQTATAIEQLERALQNTNPYYNFVLYRQILDRLWTLYFRHRQYAEAFEVKLEQRRIESLFGLRAFIGAGQIQPASVISNSLSNAQTATDLSAAIKASGRAQDIGALVERLAQPRYPIVVIHGQSGVGKSSILRAGLMPKLRSLTSEGRTTLPILVGEYGDWKKQIEASLDGISSDGISLEEASLEDEPAVETPLINALRRFTQNEYKQVVLIFDQFEDFFYKYPNVSERRKLYIFLRDCLDLAYVKVVLSLREDFLHYLLEWDRNADLEVINNDILSKEIRYYLGNFTPKAAETLIHQLSEPSAFAPEPALVAALVDDLAALTGAVRPIELQVVGAQLQRQKIETLSAYRALGRSPKKQLLNNFLDNVIHDCGPENRTVANSVLYLLSEGENRPLKSLSELREPLTLAGIENTPQQLSLVLDIFIGSGLVFEVPEVSGARYQLVHEYLASLVQDQQQASLMEVLRVERDRRALTEDQLQKALAAQSETLAEATLARQQTRIAEIDALISVSRSRRLCGNDMEALAKALQAASQVQSQVQSQANSLLKMQATLCLADAVYGIHEKNVLSGHRDWILAVDCSAFPPYHIVSASEDGTLKLWTQPGKLIRTLTGHDAGVIDVCFSPDGQYLVSASLDHTIRLWQANGDFVRTIESPQASVTSVGFNPDASIVAATYSDTTVRLWTLEGELITTLEGHEDWARAVAFSPDGQMLATGSEDKTVRLWSLAGELLHTLRRHRGWVRSVSFSPDGTMVAAAGDTNSIRLWGVNGRKLKTFYGHENWVKAVAFSPDGQRLASASDDQTIRIWGLDGQALEVFKHRSNVHSVAWSADGRSLVSGGDDDQVHIWQLEGPTVPMLQGSKGDIGIVWSARWQPGQGRSRQILSVSGDSMLRLWGDSGDLLKAIALPDRGAHSVDWHPDGTRFALACADYSIQIRQADGEILQRLQGHGDMVWQVRYSPDGKRLASVSSDRTLRLWNQQGQPLKILSDHTNTVWSVSFSPDGRYLISASEDNSLRLWHVENGLLQTIEGHTGGVWCAGFSPDGKLVASGGADGMILLWSVRQLASEQIRLAPRPIPLRGHRDWVRSLRFSPNGEFLASGSDDGTVRLWPVLPEAFQKPIQKPIQKPSEIGELLPPLLGHKGVVWDVDFDASGEQLLSAGADGTIRLWNLQLASLQRQGIDWLSDWLLARPQLRHLLDQKTTAKSSDARK